MYKYVVAVKDLDSDIYMEVVEFDNPQTWKAIYLKVVDDDYFGEDEFHKEWVESLEDNFDLAVRQLAESNIDVAILDLE